MIKADNLSLVESIVNDALEEIIPNIRCIKSESIFDGHTLNLGYENSNIISNDDVRICFSITLPLCTT